jgi:hypothetical protein
MHHAAAPSWAWRDSYSEAGMLLLMSQPRHCLQAFEQGQRDTGAAYSAWGGTGGAGLLPHHIAAGPGSAATAWPRRGHGHSCALQVGGLAVGFA